MPQQAPLCSSVYIGAMIIHINVSGMLRHGINEKQKMWAGYLHLSYQNIALKTVAFLLYDIAFIQWITSCHKNHFARARNVIENVRVSNAFSC